MEGIRFPPPVIPAAALLVAAVAAIWLPQLPVDLELPGLFLGGLGVALLVWSLSDQFRAGQNPEPNKPVTSLVVIGAYRFSRNPIYVAFLLLQAGIGLAVGWWLAPVLVPVSGWLLRRYVIAKEEAWLHERFGDQYETYARAVRRWL